MAVVKDVAFYAYSVKDVPKAVAFYRDVLGLTPGMALGDHWVEFEIGNTTFGIGDGTPLGFEPGKSGGMSLEVDDIEAMTAKLKSAGTAVGEVHDFPSCRAMFFKDPEGNNLALHQRKA
jgi:predicted enzyme related to lactoylglutathione lyase